MKKLQNKKGFTMAELLIVVAIIAVLVAISIPVFKGQLDKSKLATATANVRSAYAEYVAYCLSATPPSAPNSADLKTFSKYTATDSQGCTVTVGTTSITISNGAGTNSISADLE